MGDVPLVGGRLTGVGLGEGLPVVNLTALPFLMQVVLIIDTVELKWWSALLDTEATRKTKGLIRAEDDYREDDWWLQDPTA